MALDIQITVDCRDPHGLADWWAETLDWAVEPQDEGFIRSMIAQGFAAESDTKLHQGTLVWREGAAIRPAEDLDAGFPTRRIVFQATSEEKTVKNRVHWDVRLAGRDKDAARAALVARGAAFLWTASQGPHSWHTMTDPEGNKFCIS